MKKLTFPQFRLFCLFVALFFLLPIKLLSKSQDDVYLAFQDITAVSNTNFTHQTPITSGDGALMISGGTAGDFNNDGWQDLFVIGGGDGVADKLFINQQDGTFINMASSAGLDELHMGMGASAGDFNNDGWLDIYVTSMGPMGNMSVGQHRLYKNNGDLTFTNVANESGVNQTSPVYPDGTGSAFGDYDLDGDLDLFVAGWRYPEDPPGSGIRYAALGNRLFQNNGDGTFNDVTTTAVSEVLLSDSDTLRGFSPCFADMNGDRYPELLIAADFGSSLYFKNNTDGTFQEWTSQSGTAKEWSGMGSAIGDVNQDGHLDWYVTAIYDEDEGNGRGDGNKLYINQNGHDHTFDEITKSAGVDDGGWGWGTVIVDLNHDGAPDIVETNGWEFGEGDEKFLNENAKVWLNGGNGESFTEQAIALGLDHNLHGIGMMHLDYDNDGDQDIAITAYNDDFRLYENKLAVENTNWIKIVLNTQNNANLAPNGIGANIEVQANGNSYFYTMNSCSHYLSQSEITAHIGLAGNGIIDQIIIDWTDGTSTTVTNIEPNQSISISAPATSAIYLPILRLN
ncbi:MAG: CRTAC1 family protein [Chloroflexota bacterium]